MECWIRDSRLTGLLSKNSSGGVIPFDSSHLSSLLGLLLLRRIENLETPKTVYILTLRTSKELRLFDGSIIRGTPPWSRLETLSPHPPFFHLLLLSILFSSLPIMAPSSSSSSSKSSSSSSNSNILALNFNQDASCVAVGTRQGYRIVNCEPFGKVYSKGQHHRFNPSPIQSTSKDSPINSLLSD